MRYKCTQNKEKTWANWYVIPQKANETTMDGACLKWECFMENENKKNNYRGNYKQDS